MKLLLKILRNLRKTLFSLSALAYIWYPADRALKEIDMKYTGLDYGQRKKLQEQGWINDS